MLFNYLPYIFGTSSLFAGVYLFLLAFNLNLSKAKTEKQNARMENVRKKFGTLLKVCSICLILNGAYDLVIHDHNRYQINSNANDNQWTDEDRKILIGTCMRDAGPVAEKATRLTHDYCSCSMTQLMKAMTKAEYKEELTKPIQEQYKKDYPIIQGCMINYQRSLDSLKNTNK